MKNIDKIRQMSAEELAKKFFGSPCSMCSYFNKETGCEISLIKRTRNHCHVGVSEWLNQEINPMPEIQAGDMLFTGNISDFYVAIAPNKLVKADCFVVLDLVNVLNHNKIEYVARWKDEINDIERIWRADNDTIAD